MLYFGLFLMLAPVLMIVIGMLVSCWDISWSIARSRDEAQGGCLHRTMMLVALFGFFSFIIGLLILISYSSSHA